MKLRLRSVDEPFRSPAVYHHAIEALKRADAMGLLPREKLIESLDVSTVTQLLGHIARAGISRGSYQDLADPAGLDADRMEKLLSGVSRALEESPAPVFEWPALLELFGVEQLARLLRISHSSVRRYKAHARMTPDAVAARLHFLVLVVSDVAGAYNDIGIRRWFDRRRTLLENRSPGEILTRTEWSPTDPGPSKVRDLARSLVAAPAT